MRNCLANHKENSVSLSAVPPVVEAGRSRSLFKYAELGTPFELSPYSGSNPEQHERLIPVGVEGFDSAHKKRRLPACHKGDQKAGRRAGRGVFVCRRVEQEGNTS
jgi:hypothetical protein